MQVINYLKRHQLYPHSICGLSLMLFLFLIFSCSLCSYGQHIFQETALVYASVDVVRISKRSPKKDIRYKSHEDSLLKESKTYQISEIQKHHKTADKEVQIYMQRTDLAERNLIIQKKNLQILGWIALAMVLSFIGYVFYNLKQEKNKHYQKESELKDDLSKIELQNRLQEQRLRISRDLNDTIGAQLVFIISSIDNLKYSFKIIDQQLDDKLTSISNFASKTNYELRDAVWAINKSGITLEDLQLRLSNYIDNAHVLDETIDFSFQIDKEVDLTRNFNLVEGINIHRVIQEAIHNSLKHANSKTIKVKVERFLKHLRFSITDDGRGFDSNTVKKENGLLRMQKMANDINANLEIVSYPSEGTTVILSI